MVPTGATGGHGGIAIARVTGGLTGRTRRRVRSRRPSQPSLVRRAGVMALAAMTGAATGDQTGHAAIVIASGMTSGGRR